MEYENAHEEVNVHSIQGDNLMLLSCIIQENKNKETKKKQPSSPLQRRKCQILSQLVIFPLDIPSGINRMQDVIYQLVYCQCLFVLMSNEAHFTKQLA